MSCAYLFEAKGIQRYIFDSGPLRDLVGASDLVDNLASSTEDDLVEKVLLALDAKDKVKLSRRASGAFVLHGDDEILRKVRALWRLISGLSRPGLEMSDAHGNGADDMEALRDAYANSSAVRFNTAAELPPTGHPFTAFNPRTGRVATRIFTYDADSALFDHVSETQRIHADGLKGHDGVAERFLPSSLRDKNYHFPRNLEPEERDREDNPLFPFRSGDDRRIAVVHADLSGLGEIFSNATRKAGKPDQVLDLAKSIQNAIQTAAQMATCAFLIPYAEKRAYGQHIIPARPVVLGGDDVTILVRGDLAFPFATALLRAIEEETKKIKGKTGKDHLSACAGVAIAKAGQPFLMVNALAECLCSFAKNEAKKDCEAPYPSMLAFHIVQSTLQEEYGDILEREKTFTSDKRKSGDEQQGDKGIVEKRLCITANPIEVSTPQRTKRPSWNALIELARALDIEPRGRGKLIELRDLLLAEGESESTIKHWRRFMEVLKDRNEDAFTKVCATLTDLGVFGIKKDDEVKRMGLPLIEVLNETFENKRLVEHYCPIPDALELIDLGSPEVRS